MSLMSKASCPCGYQWRPAHTSIWIALILDEQLRNAHISVPRRTGAALHCRQNHTGIFKHVCDRIHAIAPDGVVSVGSPHIVLVGQGLSMIQAGLLMSSNLVLYVQEDPHINEDIN